MTATKPSPAALWAEVSAMDAAAADAAYVALRDRRAALYATAHRRPMRGLGTRDTTVREQLAEAAAASAEHAATELRAHLLSRRGAGLGLHPAGCSLCESVTA